MADDSKKKISNRDVANTTLKSTNLFGENTSIDRSIGGMVSAYQTDTNIPVLEAKELDFPKPISDTDEKATELLELKYGSDWKNKASTQEIQRAKDISRNTDNSNNNVVRANIQKSIEAEARVNIETSQKSGAMENISPEAQNLLEIKYGSDWKTKAPVQDIDRASSITSSTKAQNQREQRSSELNSNVNSVRTERETQPSIQYNEKEARTSRDIETKNKALETVSPQAEELLKLKYGENWKEEAPAQDINRAVLMSSNKQAQEQRVVELKTIENNTKVEKQTEFNYIEKDVRLERQAAEKENLITQANEDSVRLLELKYGENWKESATSEDIRKSNEMTASYAAQENRSNRERELNKNIETVRIQREEEQRQNAIESLQPQQNQNIPEQNVERYLVGDVQPNKNIQTVTTKIQNETLRETLIVQEQKPVLQESVSIVPQDQQLREVVIEKQKEPGDLTGITPDGIQFTVDKNGRVTYGSPTSSNVVQSPRLNPTPIENNIQTIPNIENNSLALAEKTITSYSSNKSDLDAEIAKSQMKSIKEIDDSNREDEEITKAPALSDNYTAPLISGMVNGGKRSYPNIKESFNTDLAVKTNGPPIWRTVLG